LIDPRLEGKVVLITGANNPYGIGAAIARAFATQGAKLLLTYLRISPEQYGISAAEAERATKPGEAFYHAIQMKTIVEVQNDIKAMGGLTQLKGLQGKSLTVRVKLP
jgi:3-oxoacyl-[acyl-carrier protein] reductase